MKREEVESSKDKSCMMKKMMPLLAYKASQERMPDWEWVQSNHTVENPENSR